MHTVTIHCCLNNRFQKLSTLSKKKKRKEDKKGQRRRREGRKKEKRSADKNKREMSGGLEGRERG